MSIKFRKEHQENDNMVEEADRFELNKVTELKCVAELTNMYQG